MKKNLLVEKDTNELIARALTLTPDNKGHWGNMSVTTMLKHCNVVNTAILSYDQAPKAPTIKQRFLLVGLYLMKELPKSVKTRPEYVNFKEDELEFAHEKNIFMQTIAEYIDYPKTLTAIHPVFGPLNTKEWGRFGWLHMDHHLRQFDV
ncbi:MAG: DUF1569 domain-containing protein [Hymenobacter sp.]|nr:DUF1569 domain-containing protein [Hymenobacter sp.]